MRIADSQVAMAAARRHEQGSMTGMLRSESTTSFADIAANRGPTAKRDSYVPEEEGWFTGLISPYSYGYDKGFLTRVAPSSEEGLGLSQESEITTIRKSIMEKLLQRLGNAGAFDRARQGFSGQPFMDLRPGGFMTTAYSYEAEYTAFSAKGSALTEDGRTIDFDITLEMSRSFMQYTEIRIPSLAAGLMDPLMINVSAACANISDQKFMFDLDADGSTEKISMPGSGTGFLALDKNGDGLINDGTELFGALSGDGFADLAEYDSDGNGWIDENDDVFSKLRVWCKGEDGEDILMDLSESDVGAIFLGHQQTDFSLYGQSFAMNAVIRKTGFFLKESGGAGTIQHVDLATNAEEAALPETGYEEDMAKGLADGTISRAGILTVNGNETVTGQKAESTESEQAGTEEKTEEKTDTAADRRARARERAAESRRKREELIERTLERRRIRKEQLDKLFEDRSIEKAEREREMFNEALQSADEIEDYTETLAEAV